VVAAVVVATIVVNSAAITRTMTTIRAMMFLKLRNHGKPAAPIIYVSLHFMRKSFCLW
jgi:hypothetical protein